MRYLIRSIGNYLLMGLLVTVLSCVDEVDLQSSGDQRKMVISGKITTENEPYSVTISESAIFSSNERSFPAPVEAAEVYLHSSLGEDILLTEVSPGEYQTDSAAIIGTIGTSYYLEILLADGREYRSHPEIMIPSPDIDSVSFRFKREDRLNEINNLVPVSIVEIFINLQVSTNPDNVFFRWEISGEYEFEERQELNTGSFPVVCYVSDSDIDNGQVIIGNVIGKLGDSLIDFKIFEQDVDYKFAHQYGFRIDQESLTRTAYNYFEQIKLIKERDGNVLERPVGRVRGNIFNVNDEQEEVLGYFFASSRSFSRLFVRGSDVGNPISPCEFSFEPSLLDACQECSLLDNSTKTKPPYWP